MPAVARLTLGLSLLLAGGEAAALSPSKRPTQFGREVWDTEQGLPQNAVHAILQTRDGYLWLGTEEGLARFDGVKFTVFDRSNTPALTNGFVRALLEDRDGTLWIGTREGLVRFGGGVFSRLPDHEPAARAVIRCLFQDASGAVWIGTASQGLVRYAAGRFTLYGRERGLPDERVTSIAETGPGSLWVGTGGGSLARLEGGSFRTIRRADELPGGMVTSLRAARDGGLWIATYYGGLVHLKDGETRVYSARDGLPSDTIWSMLEDRDGALWLGTANAGLCRFSNGRFASLRAADGFPSDTVISLHEDREGALWVGTNGGGLVELREGAFTPFGPPEGLAREFVWTVHQDSRGEMWFGTDDGAFRLRAGDRFERVPLGGAGGRPALSVYSLSSEPGGVVWLGTQGGGLYRFQGGRSSPFPLSAAFPAKTISALHRDRAGRLWLGSAREGVAFLQDGRIHVLPLREGMDSMISSFAEDAHGSVWIGTAAGGLYAWRGGRLDRLAREQGLSSNSILDVHADAAGVLWVATHGGGLNRVRDGRVAHFSAGQGLSAHVVYRILEDQEQQLWLSSNKGIFRVSKRELNDVAEGLAAAVHPVAYGPADGLRTRECVGSVHPAGWKDRDGRLWFPTLKGAAVVDPRRLPRNDLPPPVRVERFVVDGREAAPEQPLRLPPGSRRLEFAFTALSLLAPEKVRFRYALEPFDAGWVEAGSSRQAVYTGIPPGRYRFRVLACNNDGVWNEQGASLGFTVLPYLHQRTAFRVAVGLASAGLVWLFHRARVLALQSQKAVLLERNRIARDLHDTLAQGLTGIGVQIEVAKQMLASSPQPAIAHLERAQGLAAESIDGVRRCVLALREARTQPTNGLGPALREAAARMTEGTPLEVELRLEGRPVALDEHSYRQLLRIGQEAVTNVVKHSRARKLRIRLSHSPGHLELRVADDGLGFDPRAPAPEGFGLVGMEERAAAIGAELRIRSAPGRGTEVAVALSLDPGGDRRHDGDIDPRPSR